MEVALLYLLSGLFGYPYLRPFLHGLKEWEKLLVGIFGGILLFPLFLLPLSFGLFSKVAVLVVFLLYAGLSAYLLFRQLPEIQWEWDPYFPVLLGLGLLSFLIRASTASPIFFELDPYFYMKGALILTERGFIPQNADYAWYPLPDNSYFTHTPKAVFLGWPLVVLGITNPYRVSYSLAFYPPLVAAFLPFFVYLAFRDEWGVLAGVFSMVFPVLISKTLAGVTEMQPLGLTSLVAMISLTSLGLHEPSAAFLLLSVLFHNSAPIFVYSLLLYSLFLYLQKKGQELLPYGIALFLGSLAILPFMGIQTRYFLASAAFALPFFLSKFGLVEYLPYLPLLALIPNPLVSAALRSLSLAAYPNPLLRTIAEQGATKGDLRGALGFLAVDLSQSPLGPVFSLIHLPVALAFSLLNGLGRLLVPTYSVWPPPPSLLSLVLLGFPLLLLGEKERLLLFLLGPGFLFGFSKLKFEVYTAIGMAYFLPAILKRLSSYLGRNSLYLGALLAGIVAFGGPSYFKMLLLSLPYPQPPPSFDWASLLSWEDTCRETLGIYSAFRCAAIPPYWLQLFGWASQHPGRYLSWWDYGHWLNFFADRKAVLRNEHKSLEMIERVAHAYVMGTPEELHQVMEDYNASYLITDVEIIGPPSALGGKFFALNYLACAYANQTDETHSQMESQCERENLWELVFLEDPLQECEISQQLGLKGWKGLWLYNGSAREVCLQSNGSVYWLDERDALGDLTPIPALAIRQPEGMYGSERPVFALFYSSPDKAVSRFYSSVLYRTFYLHQLPGMREVFRNEGLTVFEAS